MPVRQFHEEFCSKFCVVFSRAQRLGVSHCNSADGGEGVSSLTSQFKVRYLH